MLNRRAIALALAVLPLAADLAAAEDYPTRPIRIVAPFPAGGSSDVTLRALADRLRVELGQPIVVENKPGAGGAIASDFVAHAPADGHSLLFAGSSFTMRPAVAKVAYDPVKDFAPISQVLQLAIFLVVRADVPARNVADLVAYMKAHPGKLAYASVGIGSVTHFQAEQFKALTKTYMVHIPYQGSAPALTDLIGGQVQLSFDGYTTSGPYIQNGSLRALAVALPQRSTLLPDVPTLAEAGVAGHDAVGWVGVLAPAGTPKAIVEKLNGAIVAAVRDPGVQAKFRSVGGEPASSTPEEFRDRIRRETVKWAELARAIGIKPE